MSVQRRLNPDRLFSSNSDERSIARELYESIKDAPIISPHGHVPVEWFAHGYHFENPTQLFLTPDHYVTRILHACGVQLSDLGVGQEALTDSQARNAFRLLGKYWYAFAGTAMQYWFEDSLERVFDITKKFSEDTADAIYDQINELLPQSEFGTRELVERFNIESISTTDDPVDNLSVHDAINADSSFSPILAPAFRPDIYLEVGKSGWVDKADALGKAAGIDTESYDGFVQAMRQRRAFFKEHGAVLSDHSHADTHAERLSDATARALYTEARRGTINAENARLLQRHLLNDQALLAQSDGLVMTIHPSVYRNYDLSTFDSYGADAGADIPQRAEFVSGLRPLLNEYGNNPDFHLVAFTIDETVFSRELAPLAGFYPALYVGAPWWFIDSPHAIMRYYEAIVEDGGYRVYLVLLMIRVHSVQFPHDMI